MNKERLGTLLLKEQRVTPDQLKKAIAEQGSHGGNLSHALTKLGIIKEEELTEFLSRQYGIPSINLSEQEIDGETINLIPKDIVLKYKIFPVKRAGNRITVAMADPTNIFVIDEIRFLTGFNVNPVVASENSIMESIDRYYIKAATMEDVMSEIEGVEVLDEDVDDKDLGDAEDAPIVKLVNMLIVDAIKKGVSDIHVEPYEKSFRVRFRLDGVLQEVMRPPVNMKTSIVSRLKILANLDIAERRLPQDGRMKMKIGDKAVDFRVSTVPTLFGEKVVMRLLDKANLQLDMTKLGFDEIELGKFKDAIYQPYGMVLVTGPTGSGKSTTLYSALQELNKMSENISTAEDPVEYNLEGINQVQIRDHIGLTFASALRSFLRQDPDIIMVGEVRDFETAETAIKAALTGHMVLSTLHTNDAPSTISRLLNMGIEPFLIVSSLNLVLAQRLMRKVCVYSKQPDKTIFPKALMGIGVSEEIANTATILKGSGCKTCNNTGYKGRIAVYEVMPMTEQIKDLVLQGASSGELKREAIRGGLSTLRMGAVRKMLSGITTYEEVVRVTMKD